MVSGALAAGAVVSAYFTVSSSAGPWVYQLLTGEQFPVALDRLQWGPNPRHFTILGPRMRNFEGRETVTAQAAFVELYGLQPTRLELLGARVLSDGGYVGIGASRISADIDRRAIALAGFRLSRLHADDFELDLRWDDEGTFNLSRTFALTPPPPKPDEPPPRPEGPPRDMPMVQVDDIVLADSRLNFEWPGGAFSARDVTARGSYGTLPWFGMYVDADLRGGATRFALNGRFEPAAEWDTIAIERYRMSGQDITAWRLALEGGKRGHLRATDIKATPNGSRATLDVATATLSVSTVHLEAASVQLNAEVEPAVIGMAGSVTIAAADAGKVRGPDGLALDAAHLRGLRGQFGSTRADLALDDLWADRFSAGWTPSPIDDPNISGAADVSLGSGSYRGTLTTLDNGTMKASGDIDISLFRQQVTFLTRVALRYVTGALAELFGVAPPGTEVTFYRAVAPLSALTKGTWKPRFERVADPAGPGGRRP